MTTKIPISEWDHVAILRVAGFTLERCELDPKTRRVQFIFDADQGEVDRLLQAHKMGRLKLPTLALFEAYKWAKVLTHQTHDASERPTANTGRIVVNGNNR